MNLFVKVIGLFDSLIRAMLGIEFFGTLFGLFALLVGLGMILALRRTTT